MRTALSCLVLLCVALPGWATDPVAVVNGEEIPQDMLQQATNWSIIVLTIYQQFPGFAQTMLTTKEGRDLHRRYERDMLEQIIMRRLQLQEAQQRGLSPNTGEVEAEVDRIVADIARQNRMTEEELVEALAQQGRTLEGLRADIGAWAAEDLMVRQLREQVVGGVSIDEDNVASYYQANLASFLDPEGNPIPLEEAREEIAELLLDEAESDTWRSWLEELRDAAEVTINL